MVIIQFTYLYKDIQLDDVTFDDCIIDCNLSEIVSFILLFFI